MSSAIVGKLIKEKREERGMSQVDLSKLIGMHRQAVSRLENGNVNLQFETAVKISNALQVPLNEFANLINVLPDVYDSEVREILEKHGLLE